MMTNRMRSFESIDPIYYRRRFSSNTIRLVWYDSSPNKNDAYEQLLRQIDPDLNIFNDITSCITAIKKLRYEECKSIFLISSGSLTKDLLPKVNSEVHSIFVLSDDQTDERELLDQLKVHTVSDSSSDLIENISTNWNNLQHGYVKEDEQESLRNLNKEKASFLWFNMFRNVVRHLHKNHEAKRDMILCLEEYFRNNDEQLKRVKNFAETYRSDRAFWWYTQQSFISDIINKALRSLDLDALFDLRYFIVDLCQLLNENRQLGNEIVVYRGVLMDKDKFETMQTSIKSKDLISMRGFLSTTFSRNTAEAFCINSTKDSNKVEILYEIHVASNLEHIIFADISKSSQFQEEEILFDLDSTFEFDRIISDEINNNRYIVKLNATDRGWFLSQKYVSFNNQQLVKQSPELLFGELLIQMGDCDKAIRYFQRLLNQENNPTQESAFVLTKVNHSIILNNLGGAWYKKGHFETAMKYFDSAFELEQTESGLEKQMAHTLNNKAVILMAKGEYQKAFEQFQHAMDMKIKTNTKDGMSAILGNMGTIKNILGEYAESLSLYEQAGAILIEEGVHENHQDIATNKMNMAFVYLNQAQWAEAERVLNEAKTMYESILPYTHPDIGRVLFSLGVVLRSQGKFEEALEHFQQAINVYEKAYGQLHAHIADAYNSMANVKSSQEQYENALILYQKAYEQFRQLHGSDNSANIGRVYNNMGQACRKLGRFSDALNYLKKALAIRQTTLGENHPDVATTLVNISLVYQAQDDPRTALEYAQRGLDIRREKLPVNNEDLIETEEFIIQLTIEQQKNIECN